MMRRASLATLALLCFAPAHAADDPAILLCEAMISEILPPGTVYTRRRATLQGNVVIIDYTLRPTPPYRLPAPLRCAYAFHERDDAWELDLAPDEVVVRCQETSDMFVDLVRKGRRDAARAIEPRVRRCQDILQAELQRGARAIVTTFDLRKRDLYPIPRALTRLVSP